MSGTPQGVRRRLSWLAVAVVVLVAGAGGFVWLFQDRLFHPFGDSRACDGSQTQLPQVISAGGAPIPAGASDVHYYTRNGIAEVTFTSGQVADYLHRAGVLPDDAPLFDQEYGSKADAEDEIALPDGLCGSPLRGPVWVYGSTSAAGHRVSVMVERSPADNLSLRVPARAVVTYHLP
ncbi:hypothetical protein [Streptomyces sp. NBC_00525]|uniref:hypothetical protein n=1 Tax=Streptomyces sp. NBC_00525 TaxID=2903660 RepID=UPI002E8195C7|nr:hypothetical protein [Streptomyces sp. NBC_00525]WUC93829.1 hypothetical protein OG710_09530 [Streptomyces sp. NBC_00525]